MCGSSQDHQLSGNVTGASAGSGLSMVIKRRAVCLIGASRLYVCTTPASVTSTLISYVIYSPDPGFVKVAVAVTVPTL